MIQQTLKYLTTVKECHAWCLAQKHIGQTLALVPTMGALHAGHLALVTHALQQADRVIVSIFVNPTQFAPTEDFDAYPRNLELDLKHLTALGVHAVFCPKTTELYSDSLNDQTLVMPRIIRQILCGQSRPHFFQGVATIVLKLLSCCQPDIAVFGEKDYQQLIVIRQMIQDLLIPCHIHSVPTVRTQTGLALSSRNQYLSPSQQNLAPELFKALKNIEQGLCAGNPITCLCQNMHAHLTQLGFKLDYLTILNPETLAKLQPGDTTAIILVAAWLGQTRLIDNLICKRHFHQVAL
jgi:pantoate--beta-alanine ligase